MSSVRGLPVIIPDGRVLGTVHDTVISAESDSWSCTHLFVSDPPASLVEGRIHVAILGTGSDQLEMLLYYDGFLRLQYRKNLDF